MNDRFAVILPTYNERENISVLLEKLLNKNYIQRVVVVDDNSSDGTREIVKNFQNKSGKVTLIERPKKLGLGSAYIEGIKHVRERYIITMDADLSHDPFFLDGMKEVAKNVHIVIGSRHVPGSIITGWNFYRYFVHIIANLLARLFLFLPYKDITSGYRIYEANALKLISKLSKSRGFSFQVESLIIAKKYGLKVIEYPIIFVNRKRGKSKFNIKEAIEYVRTLISYIISK